MEKYLVKVIFIVWVVIFLFLSKKIADAITRFDDDAQIREHDNLAVALRRFGIFVGISIALQALVNGEASYRDAGFFAVSSLIVLIIFFVAHFINDLVIVPRVSNNELIKSGNVPTGLVEAGAFIAYRHVGQRSLHR